VYLGTSFLDVNNATTSSHSNVQLYNVATNSLAVGTLSAGTLYYWRVDEVNNAHLDKRWKGAMWAFRTTGGGGLRASYYHWSGSYEPLGPPDPFANFVLSRMDPWVNFDWGTGSPAPGIVNVDDFACRWIGCIEVPRAGTCTFWTQTDDGVRLYVDDQLIIEHWVEQGPTWWSGTIDLTAGLHDIRMEYYENGGGAVARLEWLPPGIAKRCNAGAWLMPPLKASAPNPYDGQTDVENIAILSWVPGAKAAKHNVYLGTDFDNVNAATNPYTLPGRGQLNVNSYDPGGLDLMQDYYWRVDEVNTLSPGSPWKGDVWSFTTANYFVLEDYERYTNTSPLKIFETWIASGGGKVGYNDPNYAQTYIFHGGDQSMPFDYSNLNVPNLSEASRTFAATDFTKAGVKALSLWTRGYPLYVGSFTGTPPGPCTMTAGGEDIWDVPDIRHPSTFHDEFHYAYMSASGTSWTLVAKVESVSNTDAWAKAGVMMRDSLEDNSVHAVMCMTPGSGASFQYRMATGGTSTNTNDVNFVIPYWIAIERQDNTFTGYISADPVTYGWSQLSAGSSVQIIMSDPIYIGLCLTAHNAGHTVPQTCTAVFSNVHLYQVQTEVLFPPTNQDIGIKSNTRAPLYVTLHSGQNSSPPVTNPDANAVINPAWQVWDIPMSSFTGITKSAITKLTVGVGNKGSPQAVGVGTIYVDDIRLYMPRCRPDLLRNPADFTGDCLVDYYDLDILTDSWLVKPPSGVGSGLKGHWQFNGDLKDVSGNNRHGSDPCGVITYAPGYSGQAASLNGGYVRVGPVGISGAAARTVAGWAKASTMTMPTADFINVFGFTCRSGTLTNRSFDIEKWGLGNDYAIHVYGWEQAIMPVDLEWHHLAASYDGTTIRWYGDGQLVGTDSSRVLDTNDLVQMGERGDISANFRGLIDEVRIYNRALSLAEIEYLAGKPMIDINNDGSIDFKDYALMADVWLEELLWPQ
jgi:hypothetical protein